MVGGAVVAAEGTSGSVLVLTGTAIDCVPETTGATEVSAGGHSNVEIGVIPIERPSNAVLDRGPGKRDRTL